MKAYIQNYLNAKHTRQTDADYAERIADEAKCMNRRAQDIDDEELLLKMAEAIEGLRCYTEALALRVDDLEGGPLMPRVDNE